MTADATPTLPPFEPGAHPCCRADAAAAAAMPGLHADARRFAPLFDGQRNATERLAAARQQFGIAVDAPMLHEAALDLAFAGLLTPGRDEPLPPPTQIETDAWGQRAGYGYERTVGLPSLVPGSLGAPGLPGAIGGVFGGDRRGAGNRIDHALTPGPWAAIGRPFAAPALHRGLGWGVLVLTVIGLIALWQHRIEVARDVLGLQAWYRVLMSLGAAAVLVNVASQCARLCAIRQLTGRWPAFGIVTTLKIFPRLFTDTAGPAENADADARSRILLSVPLATLTLALLGEFGWFLSREGSSVLPGFSIALATLSLVSFLMTINPLARRDGYHWLADRLGAPDLRDQAWHALTGWDRPWQQRPLLPRSVRYVYAVLAIAYVVLVLGLYITFPAHWLENAYGGPGVVFFLSAMGFSLYRQNRRGFSSRVSMEPFRVKLPKLSGTTRIILAVVVVLFLLPYPYEPSGKAVVLPLDRAEVNALVAGEVREVLVREGETVAAGQELLKLSDVQTKALVAAAEATLARAQSELSIVKTGGASGEVKLAREKLATARKRLEFARAEAERLSNAFKRRAVSPQDYDQARGQAEVRQQEAAEAEQQLKLIGNPAREERIASLEAEVVKAQTELAYHREQLANTTVRAPIAGRIASGDLLFARGHYYEVGDPIAVISDTGKMQAELQMPESTMGKIKPEARAWLRVWAFPGGSFEGKVVAIAPEAEKGEYGKIVRVRVLLEDPDQLLKPEMTGQAKVRSHWTLAGFAFTRALVRFFLVEVWSWLP